MASGDEFDESEVELEMEEEPTDGELSAIETVGVRGGMEDVIAFVAEDDEYRKLEETSKKWLTLFFDGKKSYLGTSIPKTVLMHADNIKMLMEWELSEAVMMAYAVIEHSRKLPSGQRGDFENGVDTPDIKLVLDILRECGEKGVPQALSPGVLLVTLKLCYGITIPKSNLTLYEDEAV